MADLAQLEKMGRELECPICRSLLRSAASIPCNHVFCNSCILESMKSASNCPICKVPFHRRELRAAPHMDNLVSIFKSMEAATGINIVSTQVVPAGKNSAGLKETDEVNTPCAPETLVQGERKMQNKRVAKREQKQLAKANATHNVSCASVKLSFPTKKRILVTPFPISDTPARPEKISKLVDVGSLPKENIEMNRNKKLRSDEDPNPSLSPFFWLREEEDEENDERPSGQQITETPPSQNAPRFSDIKDSDDDIPCNMTPLSKAKARDAFDSEIFEWTQRACSPELCVTPIKKQTKAKQQKDQVREDGYKKLSDKETIHGAICSAHSEERPADRGKGKSKHKKTRNHRNKYTQSTTSNATDYDNHGIPNSFEETAQTSIEVGKNADISNPQRIRVENSNSILYKKRSLRRPSERDDVAMTDKHRNEEKKDVWELGKGSRDISRSNIKSTRKRIKTTPVDDTATADGEAPIVAASDTKSEKLESQKKDSTQQGFFSNNNEEDKKLRKVQHKGTENKQNADNIHGRMRKPSAGAACGHSSDMHPLNIAAASENIPRAVNQNSDSSTVKILNRVGEYSLGGTCLKKCKNVPSKVLCAFCQSADVTEVSGEMVHYFNGRPIAADFNAGANIIHAHTHCMEWAPNVYFEDELVTNLEAELARSRRIKCSCCGIKGAALGCFEKSCRKSFHFACAKLIPECHWDNENFVMLCPLHRLSKLPCQTPEPQKHIRKRTSSRRSSEVPMTQIPCRDSSQMWSWPSGSPCKWVICCSALSAAEMENVSEFAKLAGITVSKSWSSTVTHVIASTDQTGACKRTLKILLAILNGRWIIAIDWIRACMEAMKPVDEEKFEVNVDVHGIREGPRLGRLRAINKQPKLFHSIKFYFSGEYTTSFRGYLQDLIIAAGGSILHRKPISRDQQRLLDDSSPTLIIYNLMYSQQQSSNDPALLDLRRAEAQALADASGGEVASSGWIIDSIAACKLQPLC